jgi:hypothetical protein
VAKRANEIIAFSLGWNISDVTDGKYQRYSNPSVYVCGNDYYCCPTNNQKLPKGFNWVEVDNQYNRAIFKAEPKDID